MPPPRYRWTCPVCGESRVKFVTRGKREQHITNDLQSHVRTSGGGGHGPVGSYPDGIDPDALREHVERCEE